jgi:uncharacterized protein
VRALRVALLLCALASSAFALDVPPQPTNWFTDAAGVVNGSDADALNAKLDAIEKQAGVRFIVYVFPTLGDEALEDYTIRCAEQWKVWRSRRDDKGLLLTVFVKEHKIRFEVSYPLEPTITDAVSSDIIRNTIAPHFKQNDYAGGLNAAVDAVGAKLGMKGVVAPQPQPQQQPQRGRSDNTGANSDTFGCFIAIAIICMFFIFPLLARRRGCGGCIWPMFLLGGSGRGITFGGGGGGGGFGGGGGGFGGGGFGGGGSFGGGGASGGW